MCAAVLSPPDRPVPRRAEPSRHLYVLRAGTDAAAVADAIAEHVGRVPVAPTRVSVLAAVHPWLVWPTWPDDLAGGAWAIDQLLRASPDEGAEADGARYVDRLVDELRLVGVPAEGDVRVCRTAKAAQAAAQHADASLSVILLRAAPTGVVRQLRAWAAPRGVQLLHLPSGRS